LQQEIGEAFQQILNVDCVEERAFVFAIRREFHACSPSRAGYVTGRFASASIRDAVKRERDARWRDEVRHALLAFFDERRRDLPWRRDPDPYRVWVSEIMLQQTRVEAVIPYYERWLARFPDVHTLAAAELDDVLHAWQGLGYYSRARNLHRAARVVRDGMDGQLPRTTATLRTLPGIGAYTAGAIASIAFRAAEPAVDGNVRRVLARLLDEANPSPARLQAVAAALVPADRPGDFNQAFMELGATVCSPRSPSCGLCPLRAHCLAWARGTQEVRPARQPAPAIPEFAVGTAIVQSSTGRVLLQKRPPAGLLAGLWTFPGQIVQKDSPRQAAARAARALGVSIDARRTRALPLVPHTFSHRREIYHPFRFNVTEETASDDLNSLRWASPSDTETLAMPTAQRVILRRLRELALFGTDSESPCEP
jgi:A/G-specific adenine glycosylase